MSIQTASLLFAALSVCFAIHQLRRNIKWNQMNAAMLYFDPHRIASLEVATAIQLDKLGLRYDLDGPPLTDQSADKVIATPDAYTAVKHLLNMLEANAAAIKAGAIHERFAYHSDGLLLSTERRVLR
jgi:hypothetical protein